MLSAGSKTRLAYMVLSSHTRMRQTGLTQPRSFGLFTCADDAKQRVDTHLRHRLAALSGRRWYAGHGTSIGLCIGAASAALCGMPTATADEAPAALQAAAARCRSAP